MGKSFLNAKEMLITGMKWRYKKKVKIKDKEIYSHLVNMKGWKINK